MLIMMLVSLLSVLTSFPFICACFVYKSVGEVLKFSTAATHKMDIVGESYFAHWSATNGDGCGSHGVFPAWSSLGTSWKGWVRVTKHPWWTPTVILRNSPSWLFKRTALLEISSIALMAWSSEVSEDTSLHARICQMPSWSLYSCGTVLAGV